MRRLLAPADGRQVFELKFEPEPVHIDAPGGEMCAQVRTVWRLVDPASGRPQRTPDHMVAMFA